MKMKEIKTLPEAVVELYVTRTQNELFLREETVYYNHKNGLFVSARFDSTIKEWENGRLRFFQSSVLPKPDDPSNPNGFNGGYI